MVRSCTEPEQPQSPIDAQFEHGGAADRRAGDHGPIGRRTSPRYRSPSCCTPCPGKRAWPAPSPCCLPACREDRKARIASPAAIPSRLKNSTKGSITASRKVCGANSVVTRLLDQQRGHDADQHEGRRSIQNATDQGTWSARIRSQRARHQSRQTVGVIQKDVPVPGLVVGQ